ncbi:hypothetical protein GCM10009552_29130 [Rothia nasimurium]|uniref:Uncharacterized protein n=1 Tax=Luteibacter anthropi TaxID=564369 RepID=A0A7X5UAD6_9GAMM|nr:hypothetical protein [Luteibacter anthropi]NII06896.1 hypothetical protein [Luteibacter anthropi]
MPVGTIVIDWDTDRTNSNICDDLLEHDVVIVEIGTRPIKMHRAQAISEELKQRPERWAKEEDGDVFLLTYVVDSKGRICTYDTIDDLDNYDEFDVLFLTDDDGVGTKGVKAGIEKLTVEWRKRGKPNRYATYFEYDLEDDEEET